MVRSTGVHEPQRLPWFATQRTLAGLARPASQAPGQLAGPGQQVTVAGAQLPVLLGQPLEHHGHPLPLLGPAHPGRDQHHGAVAVAVGGHGPAPARRPPYLDLRPVRRERQPRLRLAATHLRNATDFLPSTAGGRRFRRSMAVRMIIPSSVHRLVRRFSTATPRRCPQVLPRCGPQRRGRAVDGPRPGS